MKYKCKCGKETINGRCKSCSNKERTGKFKWNDKAREKRKGKNNPNWKGDKVKYNGLHSFIKYNKLKVKVCEECNKNKKLDLANISGKYLRDLKDWEWLCRSCHMKYDYKNGLRNPRGKKN